MLTSGCLAAGGVLFGLSTSWWPALLVRFFVLGMGNGWVTLMAVCCAELGGPDRQSSPRGC